ncbi:MAG: hypothetical protein MUF22_04305 [Chitinispirillaceae bacterium]|nr:hypothetical protein [Chitinispirillaceae bacterium]
MTSAEIRSTPALGDIDGNGKVDLVVSTNTAKVYAFDLGVNHVHTPLEWPMAFHDPQHSMLVKEPVYKPGVKILGSWVVGTSHAKEAGTNRALIVNVYGENPSVNVAVSSVTYGGQTMTKIVEKNQGTGTRSFTGAYILNESKIAAASSSTIKVNWTTAPATGSSITSVFLSNVNQSSLIGATATGGVDAATAVATAPLATSSGDMVFLAAASANNGTYTLNNGFSRGGTEQAPSWGDFTAGYKAATGVNETPKATSSLSQRQAIVGYVVKVAGVAPVTYVITASAGTNGTISPSGTVTVTKGNSQTFTITPNSGYVISSVTVDGVNQGAVSTYTFTNVTATHTIAAAFAPVTGGNVTLLGSWLTGTTHAKEAEKNQGTTTRTYVGAFVLKESKIVAATNSTITVNWSTTPSAGSSVYSVFVSNANQTTLIGATSTGGSDSKATITTSASLANSSGDMLLLAAASANNGTYTMNNGFIRGGTEQAPSWGDFTTGYRAGTGDNKTPSVTSSGSLNIEQDLKQYLFLGGGLEHKPAFFIGAPGRAGAPG